MRYQGKEFPILNTREYIKEMKLYSKEHSKKYFASIYKEIKNRFAVGSYRDLKVKDLNFAINYINNWVENQELRGDK